MKLIFLYGPPAVGKLTVARELAARTGYKVFHNHQTFDLLEPVFGAYHPHFAPLLNRVRLEVIRTAAVAGFDGLIVTHVYGPEEAKFVKKVDAIVRRHDGQAHFVQLSAHPEALAHRVVDPSRHEFKKLRSTAELHQLMADWDVTQTIPDLNSLTIDTTDFAPEQVADQITQALGL
jgi:shikimate kinase